jgi:diacylglycerol kinase family enzyme
VKISLLYNESAGEGIASDDLKDQIERGGHQVVKTVQRKEDISRVLDSPVDLVVAAGGDGTIASAAKAVAGSGIPLAILPLGTANNIARSLGIEGALPELIEGWRHAVRLPFDLGAASRKREDIIFVEGVGGGLIPAGISAAKKRTTDEHDDVAAQVAADIRHYYDVLLDMKPCRFMLSADGTDMSGDYLVVEILNIRSIGPNIVFSADVTASDGFLSVVTAGEAHRGPLLTYLEQRMAGLPGQLSLPSRLATRVDIDGCGALHLDDESEPATSVGSLSLRIRPAALQVLVASGRDAHV